MTVTNLENLINTAALLAVFFACALHLASNVTHRSTECERYGFTLTGAGAFGTVVTLWWPRFEYFPIGYDTCMHIGMALIAGWLVQGHIRAFVASVPGFGWTDRRRAR